MVLLHFRLRKERIDVCDKKMPGCNNYHLFIICSHLMFIFLLNSPLKYQQVRDAVVSSIDGLLYFTKCMPCVVFLLGTIHHVTR